MSALTTLLMGMPHPKAHHAASQEASGQLNELFKKRRVSCAFAATMDPGYAFVADTDRSAPRFTGGLPDRGENAGLPVGLLEESRKRDPKHDPMCGAVLAAGRGRKIQPTAMRQRISTFSICRTLRRPGIGIIV
jgi:hypothetical protein